MRSKHVLSKIKYWKNRCFFFLILKTLLFFYSSFRLTTKVRRRYRILLTSFPHTSIASTIIHFSQQRGTYLLSRMSPTLTHHKHPKSIVYLQVLRVILGCCMFYEFGQMDLGNDMIPSLNIIQIIFTALKSFFSPCIHISPDYPWKHYSV